MVFRGRRDDRGHARRRDDYEGTKTVTPLSRRIVDQNPIDPCAALMFSVDRLDESLTEARVSIEDAQRRVSELMRESDELYGICTDMAKLILMIHVYGDAAPAQLVEDVLRRYEKVAGQAP